MKEVTVKFENGEREFPADEAHNFMPGTNGFSNYICDNCGCILEISETPVFDTDGSLSCSDCNDMGSIVKESIPTKLVNLLHKEGVSLQFNSVTGKFEVVEQDMHLDYALNTAKDKRAIK